MSQIDFIEEDLLSAAQPMPPARKKAAEPQLIIEPEKSESAFKTISEVASFLNVPQHVLRFWESRFSQIRPLKMRGGRRYYRPEDIEILSKIQSLLYKQGYTIKGAKKAFGKDLSGFPSGSEQQKPIVTDRQKNQLTVVRHELMALQEILKPYIKG